MEGTLICFICKKSDGKIILFSEQILSKCRNVLKMRKIHNLKYKDVILPDEYTDGGYHRECYKTFTGLMKKYLTLEPLHSKKIGKKQTSTSVPAENSSATTSFIPEFTTESSSSQCLIAESSAISQSSFIHESIKIEPTTFQESMELQYTTFEEGIENFDPDLREIDNSTQDGNIQSENVDSSNEHQIVCVFCNKKRKQSRSKTLPLHESDTNVFKSRWLSTIKGQEEYAELSNKLKNFSGPKIHYHNECKLRLRNEISSKSRSKETDWHVQKKYHELAFNEINGIIKEDVIQKGRCHLLIHLLELYNDSLEKILKENAVEMNLTFGAHQLEYKILKKLSKHVKIITARKKKIVAPTYLQSIDDTILNDLTTDSILQKAALILRNGILQTKKDKLKNITAEHLMSGEISIPSQLQDFYSTLVGGVKKNRKNSIKCARQVSSLCQNVIFAVHDGNVKTL